MDNRVKNDLLSIVRALSSLPCAKPFLKPVDTVGLNIPDYLEIVKKPMDLGTIKKNLVSKKYENTDEYLEDIYQIFDNCRRYNTDPRNSFRLLCEDLQTQFEFQWKMLQDRRKPEGEKIKVEEKLPLKREVEYIEIKKNRRVKVKEEEKEKEKEKEIEKEPKHDLEVKIKVKERVKKVEIEYEEELNFDKLTGKDEFESVIKLKVPDIIVEDEAPAVKDAPAPAKLESIEYMRAALQHLVDLPVRPLLRNTLLNAIYTVSHL